METTFAELQPLTREKLLEGLAHFNAARWWEAHESFEEAWLDEDGATRLFLQALIQLAAAYHKGIRMGSPSGMVTLFEKALAKLEEVAKEGDARGGVALAPLIAAARRGRASALSWKEGATGSFDAAQVITIAVPR